MCGDAGFTVCFFDISGCLVLPSHFLSWFGDFFRTYLILFVFGNTSTAARQRSRQTRSDPKCRRRRPLGSQGWVEAYP